MIEIFLIFDILIAVDEDLRKIIIETHELAKDNNVMLKKIRGNQRRDAFFRAVRWIVVIGISVASYYLIQPYLTYVTALSSSAKEGASSLQGLMPASGNFQDLVKQYQELSQ